MGARDTKLLVLGVVMLREPTYGYEIEKELKAWNADRWAGVARASIYNQLKHLSKSGMLQFDSTSKTENRPTQYRYRITDKGRQEFLALVHEKLDNPQPQPGDLMPVLCFIPYIPEEDVTRACRRRLQNNTAFLEAFDDAMETWFPTAASDASYDSGTADTPGVSNTSNATASNSYIQEIFHYEKAAIMAETAWLKEFLKRLPTYYSKASKDKTTTVSS